MTTGERWLAIAAAVLYGLLLGLPVLAQPGGAGIENPPTELEFLTIDPGPLRIETTNSSADHFLVINNAGAASGDRYWAWRAAGETLFFGGCDDDGLNCGSWLNMGQAAGAHTFAALFPSVTLGVNDSSTTNIRGTIFNTVGTLKILDDVEFTNAAHGFFNSAADVLIEDELRIEEAGDVSLRLSDTSGVSGSRAWRLQNVDGVPRAGLCNDGFSTCVDFMSTTRTANTLNTLDWTVGQFGVTGQIDAPGGIDLEDGQIVDSTDGNVTVGDDLTVVGDLTVTGFFSGGAFGGHVDSAATAEDVPTGWSAALAGSTYTVTHGLGLAAATDLAVTCTPVNAANHQCNIRAIGTNSFDVQIVQDDGANVSSAWFFTAVLVAN